MTTPILLYRQQQNIAQSRFSPFVTVFEKKVGNLKIDAAQGGKKMLSMVRILLGDIAQKMVI